MEKLSASGQRSILTAQLYLLNSGDFYVRQLGGDHHPKLKENLRKWDKAKNLEAESEVFARQKTTNEEQARKLKREAREELKKMLVEDDDVHIFTVNAVRDKLRSYQYDISSIPFEIFQNADDAYQEALTLGTYLSDKVPLFAVHEDNNSLGFYHWGRLINEYHSMSSPEIGKQLGFDRDLEKMLTLSFSEKNIADNELFPESKSVTGKFGLGFKCVFFASSAPKVVSGRLNFHIRGGFYPQRLNITDEENLKAMLSTWKPDFVNFGTAIELPLGDNPPNRVLERFNDLLGLLLAFSRQIKTCIIRKNSDEVAVTWVEYPIPNTNSWFVGDVNYQNRGVSLILRPSGGDSKVSQSAILFQISSRGIEQMNSSIPSVWITAPTQERTDSGYVVNGPFDPDVGRSRLALNSQNNLSLASELASAVGGMFIDLYRAIEINWNEVASTMRLSRDLTPEAFWISFWELTSSNALISSQKQQEGSASNILYRIMWGDENSGYYRFILSCRALPSGLKGNYKGLLSLTDALYRANGVLDLDEIFEQVSHWKSFQQKIMPGSIISDSNIFQPLTHLLGLRSLSFCQKITLVNVLENELKGSFDVIPSVAQHIGCVINREFIKKLLAGELTSSAERNDLLELLSKLKFKSMAGTYRTTKELISSVLLLDQIDKDEIFRSQFAPPECIVSTEYKESGIELFLICREKMHAPADLLDRWARGSIERGQLLPVFLYLLGGDLRYELSAKLTPSWLRSIMSTDEFEALIDSEQNELKRMFSVDIVFIEQALPPIIPPTQLVATLDQIYNWWTNYRQVFLKQYDNEIFPDQQPLQFTYKDVLSIEDDIDVRKKWILLFMLGSFHTMGRTIPGQHRNFIKLCIDKKWLDRFADPKASSDSLLCILDEYLSDPFARSPYYHWMKQFISFYQISKWLPTYVYSIVEIAKIKEPFALETIFNVRKNTGMTGTGLDAPPLDKGLGIGACFIVRELLRCSFFDNTFAYEHAFVPRRGVRSILAKLGGPCTDGLSEPIMSKEIYKFLQDNLGEEKAHYHKSFDIPFAVLAKHPDLLHQLPDIEFQLLDEEPVEYLDDE